MKQMKVNPRKILCAVLALVCIAALGVYFYFNVDMTGEAYADIVAFREANPNRNVSYTVTLDGDTPVKLNESSTSATLTASHVDSLVAQKEYLQGLTEISFPGEALQAKAAVAVLEAFPDAAVTYDSVTFLGKAYPYSTTTVDLSDLTSAQVQEAGMGLNALPKLKTVELCKGEELSTVALEDAAALHTLCPNAEYSYRIELYEQVLTMDMERVEYLKKDIGDKGLAQFELLMPMMHKLNYLRLDWCGTTDEVMAEMRENWAEKGVKIVWRVFFGPDYSALTDTYKIWANWDTIRDSSCEVLKYCTEVRYLDLGHSSLAHCEFVRYMPNLEVCILSISYLEDISPLADCPNLWWVEFFWTFVDDLSPLAGLEKLEYLNICNVPAKDISPLFELPSLKKLHCAIHNFTDEQIAEFYEYHPDCDALFTQAGDPTLMGWRHDSHGYLPQYKLLRAMIGYDTYDESKYPGGYLDHEVTYESEGITPPD